MTADPFLVPITGLRRRPGSIREEHRRGSLRAPAAGGLLEVTGSHVPHGSLVSVDVTLSVVDGGIVVTGEVRAPWSGECRRCLRPVAGEIVAEVRELYRPRAPGEQGTDEDEETYPLGADELDLRPLARDAILLALPLAPLCDPDCAGLCPECGADLNDGPCGCEPAGRDPRWAALDALKLDGLKLDALKEAGSGASGGIRRRR